MTSRLDRFSKVERIQLIDCDRDAPPNNIFFRLNNSDAEVLSSEPEIVINVLKGAPKCNLRDVSQENWLINISENNEWGLIIYQSGRDFKTKHPTFYAVRMPQEEVNQIITYLEAKNAVSMH